MTSVPMAEVQEMVARLAAGTETLRVLEAGCGSLPRTLDIGPRAHLVGIDISREQLDRNDAIDEKILGDIQAHEFEPDSFDLVICWDVLEHLPRPELALDNFRRAVRPGGLVVLKLPNVLSAKGLVTKFTPHGFHVWVYRRIFGYPNAGKPGFTPFRTFLRWSIAPHRLVDFAGRNDMVVEYVATYEADRQTGLRDRLRLRGRPWAAVNRLARRASRGRLDLEGTEVLVALRKPVAGGV
ncbi:MAG TPA: class I SAM-dependent methyltransferase [Solirubrobacteraceae bacterium]|nr:class I SAM-dependent methyltransferase [Solirubrobacteraceae bacterium]